MPKLLGIIHTNRHPKRIQELRTTDYNNQKQTARPKVKTPALQFRTIPHKKHTPYKPIIQQLTKHLKN